MKNRKWFHATTRVMGLLEIQLANEVYPKFPITKNGFNLDTVVIGKDGILERYVDEEQLKEFERLSKANDYRKLFKGFAECETRIIPELKELESEPMKNRAEFMKIFRQLWIHEITGFFVGLYCTDKESLDMISDLRGSNGAQHVAISEFLPKMFNEISNALKIDAELLKYAMPEEILSLNLDAKVLAERQKRYVLELIGGELRLLAGKKADEYADEFYKNIKSSVDENITEFSGNPAYPGRANGKVVLVVHDNDLINVHEGDILVSPMTRTSFLPAMKRAAAFVTDEGGVTCHAAIMAREMKKPCVVGTKIASKILKNGMNIDVDADSGLIKIIK